MIYPFQVKIFGDYTCWVAKSSMLLGCIGQGGSPEEAISELTENEQEWLETAKEFGIPIPEIPVLRSEDLVLNS